MTIAVTMWVQASFISLFCLFEHVYHSFAHDKNASYTMYERLSLAKKGSALHFDHGLCKQRKEKTNRSYMCTSPWHRLFQRFWIDARFVFCSTHFMSWRMYCFSVHFLSFFHLCAPRSSQECQLYTPPEMDWIQLCLQTIHETQRIVKQTNHSQLTYCSCCRLCDLESSNFSISRVICVMKSSFQFF